MTDQTPHPPSGEPLMTAGDAKYLATDFPENADESELAQRILATYHAHAALQQENDSLRATVEGWQTAQKDGPRAAITQDEGRETP